MSKQIWLLVKMGVQSHKFIPFSKVIFTFLALAMLVWSAPIQNNYSSKTLKYYSDIRPEGSYEYAFETDNGIYAQESASIKNSTAEDVGLTVQGSYLYQSPEGISIHLTYTADENGFHPQGDHLPTPPPIPPQILRALAWIEQQKQKQQFNDQNTIKESFFENVTR